MENADVFFEMADEDFTTIDQLVGKDGERGVRNLDMRNYLGFDISNEEVDEP